MAPGTPGDRLTNSDNALSQSEWYSVDVSDGASKSAEKSRER
jgi:hypothetical protein